VPIQFQILTMAAVQLVTGIRSTAGFFLEFKDTLHQDHNSASHHLVLAQKPPLMSEKQKQ